MGERWTIWKTDKGNAWIGGPVTDGRIEVVPASALKRCEEERDDWRKRAEFYMDESKWRADYEKFLHRAESAEAKCERLEADHQAGLEALGRIHKMLDDLGFPALSTPKTEGERCPKCESNDPGRSDLTTYMKDHGVTLEVPIICPDSFHSPDPIGRDVRGYEK